MNKNVHLKIKNKKLILFFTISLLMFFISGVTAVQANDSMSTQEVITQKRISLNIKKQSIKYILTKMEDVSGIEFAIGDDVNSNSLQNLSIIVNNKTIKESLDLLFAGTDYTYKIVGNVITIIKKVVPNQKIDKIVVKGRIVEASGGKPIVGATVLVKGTSVGAITDDKGEFSLSTNSNSVIEVSYTGKKGVIYNKPLSSKVVIIIEMEDDVLGMEDVVVTGMFNRRKETFTGSSVTVTAKELKQYGNRNVLQSLRNIDPSFNILDNNVMGSDPNTLANVQIRGNGSLPNTSEIGAANDDIKSNVWKLENDQTSRNTPLVIVDGFTSSLQYLTDMNENEIESITILKDASATAIYGSNGANGVVVITTKLPTPGKLKVTYRGDFSVEMPDLSAYDLLNAREKLSLEKMANVYTHNTGRVENQLPLDRYYNYILNEINSGTDTNWLEIPVRAGYGHRHNIRLEGGDQSFRYSGSFQYNDIQGAMKESSRSNMNMTINLTYNYKDLKFTNNLILGFNKSNNSPYGKFSDYVKLNPYWRVKDDNGNVLKTLGNYGWEETIPSYIWSTWQTNPLYDASLNMIDSSASEDITNNTSIEWKIKDKITLRGRLGIRSGNSEADNYLPSDHTRFNDYIGADLLRKGSYDYGTGKSFSIDGNLNLSYSDVFGKHYLYVGADLSIRQNTSRTYGFSAEGFIAENLDFITMAMQYKQAGKPTGSESKKRSVGATAIANYSYDNRYFGDFSIRMDGSSEFGSNSRFAPFWSAGLGWNVHEEKFLKDIKQINRLKLRGSIGITGTQNFSPYQALSTYEYYTDDRYGSWMGAHLMSLGNDDLKWQQKLNKNIGLDVNLFDSRLALTADYYIETTKDLVSSIDLTGAHGFRSYVENIGKVENRGFELKLTGTIIRNYEKDIIWSITASALNNKNKIIELSQAMKDAQKTLEEQGGANPNTIYKEGYSTNTLWVVRSYGIDPSNGSEFYIDRNGDPTYTWDARDLNDAGTTDPKLWGNINTMFRYKGFSANLSFGYRIGGKQYNSTLASKVENVNFKYNVDSRVYKDRWERVGDIKPFKGILNRSATNKTSRFIQTENLFRLQNVSLSYDVTDGKFLNSIRAQSITVSASMADLFYLSTVKQERGISYPYSRQLSISLSVTF